MSSPFVPSAAPLRKRGVWSSVFRSPKYNLPLPPRPKDVDKYNANRYIETGERDRPAARLHLHATYAQEVARKMEMGDRRYLEHLAIDLGTHEAHNDPEKLRDMLQGKLYNLFRPRLKAYFTITLPIYDEKDDHESEDLLKQQFDLSAEERLKRIDSFDPEPVLAEAWCEVQLDGIRNRIKVENRFCNGIWNVWQNYTQPEDVVKAAEQILKSERILSYFRLIKHTFEKRKRELEKDPSASRQKAKDAYEKSRKSSKELKDATSDPVAFHQTPEIAELGKDEVEQARFWLAWVLSRPSLRSAQRCGPIWRKELGKFIKEAQAKQPRNAESTVKLLEQEKYSSLRPFAEMGRKAITHPLPALRIPRSSLSVPTDPDDLARAVRTLTGQTAVPSSSTAS